MTTSTLIVLFLSALFAAYLFVLAYVALRRRQERREKHAIASLQRKRSVAWERLGNSAAGAP